MPKDNTSYLHPDDHVDSFQPTNTVKGALKTGGNPYGFVLEKGWLSKEQPDDRLKPENMTDLQQIPEP